MEIFTSFVLCSIAAFSTCLGYIFTFIKTKNNDRFICISLSFAFGVMILISIKELIPIPLKYIYLKHNFSAFLSILIIIPIIILFLLKIANYALNLDNNLFRVGVLNTISLVFHNILEGIITFITSLTNFQLGLKLALAIMAHNIPEGISISIPIYYSTKNRVKAFKYTFIAGLSEVVGALFFYILFKNYITVNLINIILYIIGCLMIIISLKEILPTILKYNNKIWFLEGVVMSLFILLL